MISIRAGYLVALAAVAQTPNASQSGPAGTKRLPQIEFVSIAPGEFMMGCLPDDKDCVEDEVPRRKVRLTKGFEMGKYEVTQAQWEAAMGGSNPSKTKGISNPDKEDVYAFLAKLTAQNDGYKYRLPTEAEWEYAARAGAARSSAGCSGRLRLVRR